MASEDSSRGFCREPADKIAMKKTTINPGTYRDPLPFNLKNPYAFTAKFFVFSTLTFMSPFLIVLYQMGKSARTS
ncbi:uncharacterized protein LOC129779891 [Toxorhynchites rutilus septentrionalis]|uniref:uncharacterized protein LOC129779891 n=1 Tax=Toxorhynchites rutilus septentrionalis TaxID=329112 RepID=UPI00247AD8A0|nr:uncharacterized protein LOC129779891 [Toxorhynchites rutilus septentrionalis]